MTPEAAVMKLDVLVRVQTPATRREALLDEFERRGQYPSEARKPMPGPPGPASGSLRLVEAVMEPGRSGDEATRRRENTRACHPPRNGRSKLVSRLRRRHALAPCQRHRLHSPPVPCVRVQTPVSEKPAFPPIVRRASAGADSRSTGASCS